MGSTYQRTILLALVLAGAVPVALVTAAGLLVERHPELSAGDATTVTLAIAVLTLGATILLAVGASRAVTEPIQTLREGLSTIVGSNRRHRLPLPAERDLAEMATGINLLADQADQATGDLDVRLTAATREIALEKGTLESVLFAIVDGVVVCNEDLQIVLSNAAARRMLSQPSRPLRRGESVFAYLPAGLLRPLVDSLAARRNGAPSTAQRLERGTLTLANGMVADLSVLVVGEEEERRHHVLVLRDVTERVRLDRSRDRFLLEAVQQLRGPVAAVLSAAEILHAYDDLPSDQRDAFLEALHQDAERIAEDLDAMQAAAGGLSSAQAGEPVSVRDLAESAGTDLSSLLEERGQRLAHGGGDVLARGDRLALLQVVRQLVALLSAQAAGGQTLAVDWRQVDADLLELTVAAPECERFDDAVFDGPLAGDGRSREDHGPRTIRSVVLEHHGEVWVRCDGNGATLVLSLPVAEPRPEPAPRPDEDAVGRQILALVGEGGFYDPSPPLDRRPSELHARLVDLSYVVFDLETTGLGPGRGDEVVSIGAVRVRAGRLIPEDYFFSLVDPKRPIPRSATRIHGITDEMVAGQPPLADVLPRFGEFVDGSVPVAHLASFDLQFINPRLATLGRPPLGDGAVLDTLLLSCSLFPSWGNYNLEQIAERLDLTVVGRHTSLGDALTTAEILVRLLGVLEQRGVRTLEEALKLQRGDAVSRLVETLRAKQSWG